MKTISDHVLDIVQNSVRANATMIEIMIVEDNKRDIYTLQIIDNGCGMDETTLRDATNPFFTSRTTRKVGLGLPLLKHNALASKGTLTIDSKAGKGTTVKAEFQLSHLDRPPAGDMAETVYLLIIGNPGARFIFSYCSHAGKYIMDSAELTTILGDVPLQQADIKAAIIEMIRNNLEELKASK